MPPRAQGCAEKCRAVLQRRLKATMPRARKVWIVAAAVALAPLLLLMRGPPVTPPAPNIASEISAGGHNQGSAARRCCLSSHALMALRAAIIV